MVTDRALELAGFFAAHAVWCVSEGETLVPILAYQHQDGRQELRRIEAEDLQEAVAQGKEWLSENPEAVDCAVLVYDAVIPLSTGRTDCLMVELRSYQPALQSLTLALPYRHGGSPEGFAVHRPKFFTSKEDAPSLPRLGEVFFRGVAQHEKGSALWTDHLDESV